MNNDLISREALKEALGKSTVTIIGYGKAVILDTAYDIIDNAPTVEPFEPDYVGAERLKARQRGYADGYRNGMEIGKTLNPKIKQGKWIKIFENPFTNGYVCPFCGHKIQVTEQFLPKVTECEVCGAELKGEGE